MEYSKLYDLIEKENEIKWWKEAEREDSELKRSVEKHKEELNEKLTEEQMKEVERYRCAYGLYIEYIYYNLEIKYLNLGVKIGMELQQAFTEMDEE